MWQMQLHASERGPPSAPQLSPVSAWDQLLGRCQSLKLHAAAGAASQVRERDVLSPRIAQSVLLAGRILREVAGYAIRKITINRNSGQ